MDKRKGLINVAVSVGFKLIVMIVGILSRRYLIRYIGNEVNGINSLFTSILGVLSVAELGIGGAIIYCMYKPIVEGDTRKVAALYGLFVKAYYIIAIVITVVGCALMPALPYLARGYNTKGVNIYLTFGLTLMAVVMSYMYSAKSALFDAYKNNYITTTIHSSATILMNIAQIIVAILLKSFIAFLICSIVSSAVQWLCTNLLARKMYSEIISIKSKLDEETRKEVNKNIKAVFMHKISDVLVNTADSVIISSFISVYILGLYSNYTTIVAAMIAVLNLLFAPLVSVVGHMFVEEDKTSARRYFNFFYTVNFIVSLIFFLGYYAVIDNLVTFLFDDGLEMSKFVSFVITLNYFIQFMKRAVRLFKDAHGDFYYDRWKCVVEGVINIGLSIGFVYLFGYWWGDEFAVVGVIVATILTNLFICHIVEPHVMFKYSLNSTAKYHYIRNYCYVVLFFGLLVALHFSMIESDSLLVELFANGGISLAYSLSISAIVILINKDFKHYMKSFLQRIFNRRKGDVVEASVEMVNSSENCVGVESEDGDEIDEEMK